MRRFIDNTSTFTPANMSILYWWQLWAGKSPNRDLILAELTKVADVHDGVEPGLEEDEDSEELVDVDVVVEREEESEPELSEFGDHVAVNEQEDQAGVE